MTEQLPLPATHDELYAVQMRGLDSVINLSAAAIGLSIIASVATDPRSLAIAIALQVLVIPMNVFVSRVLVPRHGPRVEVWRTVVNQVICCIGFQLIGWPLPVWLWLPFAGLAFDQWGGRHTLIVMVIMCGVQDAAGLAYGVAPIYPLTFTLLAVICWLVAGRRLQVIRDMLAASELQRVELERAHEDLKREVATRHAVELELRQAQKLEAIGRLAAGVAHEINTPVQFVGDSLHFVAEGVRDLLAMCESSPAAAAAAEAADIDVAYLATELPRSVELAAEGVQRVAKIVQSMKQFAHHGGDGIGSFEVNEAIETTLIIAKHEYKLVADIERRLGDIPTVTGNTGELNQVLLNLVVNAAHAIEDVVKRTGERGTITVASAVEGDRVRISITDTGTGIPEAIRRRVFEPFFTTKEVGRGTGQGLAIARAVIERHGGELAFETELGRGTTFHVCLPIRAAARLAA